MMAPLAAKVQLWTSHGRERGGEDIKKGRGKGGRGMNTYTHITLSYPEPFHTSLAAL